MKKNFFFVSLLFLTGCERSIDIKNLSKINNHLISSNKNYNGSVYQQEAGRKVTLGKVKNGKKIGIWFDTGPILVHRGQYDDGKRNGIWNGRYRTVDQPLGYTGEYKDDLKVGEWKGFSKKGKLLYIGNFINGLKDSTWKYWYENGILSDSGKYKDGIEVGSWKYYKEDGSFEKEKFYKQ